ncbi:MAG: hypothetical protein JWP02_2923 [Acidimicrobiales bacterium]|nr:hypothetical protein [Acidimicrobiales bacterium]
MTTDRTRQLAVGLAVVQVLDAVANEIPRKYVKAHLDHLGVPAYLRPVLTPIKMSTAAGLLLGLDRPRLGALVSASLVAYYSAAARFHLLAGDNPLLAAPAAVCGAAAAVTLVERFLPAASRP